jgi:hypothetical protein
MAYCFNSYGLQYYDKAMLSQAVRTLARYLEKFDEKLIVN